MRPKTNTSMQNNEQVTDALDQENEVEDTDTTEDTSREEVTEASEPKQEKNWEEIANNYKIRAEKAERKAKEIQEPVKKVELTNMDILAIAKSDVHEEDIDRVTKFAQMEGISVKEALANSDLQAILERRQEARRVAEASNTGKTRNTTTEQSADALLDGARQGKMPDPKNLDSFFEAQLKAKKRR